MYLRNSTPFVYSYIMISYTTRCLIVIFFLLLVVSSQVSAQTDLRKGFVITLANDTIAGLIDYREGERIYNSCNFRVNQGSETVRYLPNQLVGYGITGEQFFQSKGDTLFYEVLVSGKVDLYRYKDRFYVQKDIRWFELKNELIDVYIDNRHFVRNSNKHFGILNLVLEDCLEVKSSIERVTLAARPLTRIITRYNECTGGAYQDKRERKPWSKLILGITAGANASQLRFSSSSQSVRYLTEPKETSFTWTAGITAEYLAPRFTERISFVTALLYVETEHHLFSKATVSSTQTVRYYSTFGLRQLKVPIGLRYTFPARTFTPYIEVGGAYTSSLKISQSLIRETESSGLVSTDSSNEIFVEKDNQLGVWGGFGVLKTVGKFDAYAAFRYEQTNGVTSKQYADFSSSITNYQLTIGIKTR